MASVCTTLITDVKREVAAAKSAPYLVQIRPAGAQLGARYVLGTQPLLIGRSDECAICTRDASTSRRHARIEPLDEGRYQVVDLQSTNGTFVNDEPVTTAPINDGDYLRVGNVVYRFLMPTNVEVAYHEELQQLSTTDPLTLVHNRRGLELATNQELARARRTGQPLAIILFDVDHFKAINDGFGHAAGDATLRELAARVETALRRGDVFARLGGDEFAILLPASGLDAAALVAERLRLAVARKPFQHAQQSIPVTISLGTAIITDVGSLTFEQCMQLADDKLYEAKQNGRNRVAW